MDLAIMEQVLKEILRQQKEMATSNEKVPDFLFDCIKKQS